MHICKSEGSYVGLTCSLACSCCTTALCAEVAPAGIYSVSLAVQKFSLLTILSHSRSKFVSLTDPLLLLHMFIYLFIFTCVLFVLTADKNISLLHLQRLQVWFRLLFFKSKTAQTDFIASLVFVSICLLFSSHVVSAVPHMARTELHQCPADKSNGFEHFIDSTAFSSDPVKATLFC